MALAALGAGLLTPLGAGLLTPPKPRPKVSKLRTQLETYRSESHAGSGDPRRARKSPFALRKESVRGANGDYPVHEAVLQADNRNCLADGGAMTKCQASRRRFLAAGIASASAAGLPQLTAAQGDNYGVDDQVAFRGQTRRLKLTQRGRCMTSLIFATDYPTHFRLKPELYPVCTPAGVPVTDSHQYCFIHHQSIMTGHGSVRLDGAEGVVDFYRQLPYPDYDREDKFHKGKNLFHQGPSGIQKITAAQWQISDRITIELALQWQSREQHSEGGQPLVLEQRRYEVSQRGDYTIIDQFSQLKPATRPFSLPPDRHSFVGVRVHDLIDPDEGGVMRDSEGRVNPDGNYWDQEGDRQAPLWIDCTGHIGSNTAGIAMFSHPSNVRNEFYCRGWGLMICSATLGHEVRVREDQPFLFAARFVAHDGKLAQAAADKLYQQFASRTHPMRL